MRFANGLTFCSIFAKKYLPKTAIYRAVSAFVQHKNVHYNIYNIHFLVLKKSQFEPIYSQKRHIKKGEKRDEKTFRSRIC